MQLITPHHLALLAFGGFSQATPVGNTTPSNHTNLDLLSTATFTHGNRLNVYGYKTIKSIPTRNELAANQHCGGPFTYSTCDETWNLASTELCRGLVAAIDATGSAPVVGTGTPRSICFSSSTTNQCCISWSKQIPRSLQRADLLAQAQAVLNLCSFGGTTSGSSSLVMLSGTCTSQCMSNRPDGCG